MLTGLQHTHSFLRWVLLILLIVAVAKAFTARSGSVRFFEKNRKLALFTLITAHLQLILGFVLYFMKGHHLGLSGEGMKDSLIRFFSMEHMLGMLIAIVLITVGYKKIKGAASDVAKYKAMLSYYGFALILILVSIPWPFRFEGFGWF